MRHKFEGEVDDGIEAGFWTRPTGFGFWLPPLGASCVFLNGEAVAEEEDTELRKREVGFPVHPLCSSPSPSMLQSRWRQGFAKGALVSKSPRSSSSSYVGRRTERAWRGNLSPRFVRGREGGRRAPFHFSLLDCAA